MIYVIDGAAVAPRIKDHPMAIVVALDGYGAQFVVGPPPPLEVRTSIERRPIDQQLQAWGLCVNRDADRPCRLKQGMNYLWLVQSEFVVVRRAWRYAWHEPPPGEYPSARRVSLQCYSRPLPEIHLRIGHIR